MGCSVSGTPPGEFHPGIAALRFLGVLNASGPDTGGWTVQILGRGFTPTTQVSVASSPCTTLTWISSEELRCVVPAQPAGPADMTVSDSHGQSARRPSAVNFLPSGSLAPTVVSVAPSSGALAGGTNVTVTGTGFVTGATVDFGGNPCTTPVVVTPTSLTCTTAAHGAGAVVVTVTNPDTLTGSATAYTYRAAPTVAGVTPSVGPLAGGTAVTISGTGFFAGATANFGGVNCTGLTVVNATTITCATPGHAAGAVTVTVTNADTQSGFQNNAFTYQPAPTVSSIAPNGGLPAGGTAITITGTGFLAGATASLGGSPCNSLTVVNPTTITCTTTAHAAGTVSATVTNTDTQSDTGGSFTYRPAPTVASVSPLAGPLAGGTTLTVTGTGFVAGASVDVGGAACTGVTVVSATSITCTSPAHAAGTVSITVTNTDTQSGTGGSYTYQDAPTVASIAPSAGPLAGGTAITITGADFLAGATASVGGSPCNSLTVVNPTTITCTTTAHAAGTVSAVVTNVDAQFGSGGSFTYQAAPTVSLVTPGSGDPGGGTAVTVTGTGFLAGATVDFGGSPCTGVTVVNPTTIDCTTPAHAPGSVIVIVTNTDSQSGFQSNAFTYGTAPGVSNVAPSGGPLAGGTAITITGVNFVAGAVVDIGGSACTGVVVVTANTITCTTPAHAAGAVTVTVTNLDTQSGFLGSAYTYSDAPTVTSIAPSDGPLAGGTAVTITGTNFAVGATASLGGSPCNSLVVVNPTTITCTTTAHGAGAVTALVTNIDTQSGTGGSFTYRAAPDAMLITPVSGPTAGGTAITLTGSDFISGATVDFGGTPCLAVVVVDPSTITCTTAAHAAGTVVVLVTNPDGQVDPIGLGFEYVPPPTVSSITPSAGPLAGGTAITVTGTGFLAGATVDLAGSTCVTPVVVNPTTITCTTTAHAAGTVSATVTNPDTLSDTGGSFTYQAAPNPSGVVPNTGPVAGGTSINIGGTGFLAGATVDVGGSACTSVVVNSANSITCTTPAHAAGLVAITVTNTDGQNGSFSGFTYQAGAPTMLFVSPNAGALAGGTNVTLTGTNFAPGATVLFDVDPCTSVVVVNATTITCTTPAHAPGDVTVTVTNPDTQSVAVTDAYTYQPPPSFGMVTPYGGALAGGTAVTVFGGNFLAGATVDFGGSPCNSLVVVNATTITCTTTAHAAGPVVVTITNVDGQDTSSAGGFTYQAAPTVAGVAPGSGPTAGNTAITITGSGFLSGATVDVDGSPCGSVIVVNSTTITCATPPHALGATDVFVTNNDGQFSATPGTFTYVAGLTVTNVNPGTGSIGGGTGVTITGTGFQPGADVDFDTTDCDSIVVVNPTTITCFAPAHPAGTVSVTVTNPDTQTFTLGGAFNYAAVFPGFGSITPNIGPTSGGTPVTVTGTNFALGMTVTLGGAPCTPVVYVSSTQVDCITGAHAAGVVNVDLDNPGGYGGSAAAAFTYTPAAPLSLTSVTPPTGDEAGGTAVTVLGDGFVSGATVLFDASPCTSVVVVDPNTITCVTPAHAAGLVSVTVTNPDMSTVTNAALFEYVTSPPYASSKFVASDPTVGGRYGTSVSLSNTIALVGAPHADGNSADSGAAYLYRLDPSTETWMETKFVASDGSANDLFGTSVSVSDSLAAVGAYNYNAMAGAVYVYLLNPTTNVWLENKIQAGDASLGAGYGYSVAVTANAVVVGAPFEDSAASNAGAYYLYRLDPSNGSIFETKQVASDPQVDANFGVAVAMSGTTIVAGASGHDMYQGAAYVYRFDPSSNLWAETILEASDGAALDAFGGAVAVQGTTLVVGTSLADTAGPNSGAAYVYRFDPSSNLFHETKLVASDAAGSDAFGVSVALSGERVLVGAYGDASHTGAAYQYKLDPITNGYVETKYTAADGAVADDYGVSVAVSGDRFLIGASRDDDSGSDTGSAYLIELDPTTALPGALAETKITSSAGAPSQFFGYASAISGNTVVVGAHLDSTAGPSAGAAYIFRLDPSSNTWQETKILASDAAANDWFGFAVAVSDNTVVVGASGKLGNTGRAYVYRFDPSSNTWDEDILLGSDLVVGDRYGCAVGVSGTVVVVGAQMQTGQTGAAYIHRFDPTSNDWHETKLLATDGVPGNRFGTRVAISGGTVAVTAPSFNTLTGKAYVYRHNASLNNWAETIFPNPTGLTNETYGSSVAISGTTMIVGAFQHSGSRGIAYIYRLDPSSNAWSFVPIIASNGAPGHQFGISVGISATTAVVGAMTFGVGGAAYVYRLDPSSHAWHETSVLASDSAPGDSFGISVGASGTSVVVGAAGDQPFGPDSGSAYIYRLDPP